MKKQIFVSITSILFIFGIGLNGAFADTGEALEDRVKILEEKMENHPPSSSIGKISDAITLSGAIELDYTYTGDSNVSDNTINSSSSELEIGTVELGLEAALHDYVSAYTLLKGENLDTTDRIFWDEVYFTIKKEDFPLYFTGGKRCQPFGVYESLFINDPVTQDLYEINDSGATVGFADDEILGLDLSFTVYKGAVLITKVNDAGYGWSRDNTAGFTDSDDVESYIVSGSISPVEPLTLSAFYNSEPGDTDRNTTAGGAVHFEMAGFIADAEYITALEREKHVTDNKEYTETAWTASLGYHILDPFVVAVRYEDFDADKNAAGNLDFRYGCAVTYTLFQNNSFACDLMGEYRRTEYETAAGSTTDEDLDEFFVRIAVSF